MSSCLSTDRLYRPVWTSRAEGAGRECHTHTALCHIGLNLQGTVERDSFHLCKTFRAFGHIKSRRRDILGKKHQKDSERLVCSCKRSFDCFESAGVNLCHACGCGLLLRRIFLLSLARADAWSGEAGTWQGVHHHLDWRAHISLFCPGEGALGQGTRWPSSPSSPQPYLGSQ